MTQTFEQLKSTHYTTSYSDFTVKWASLEWECKQALELRRRVFCLEQALFADHDRDEIDDQAQCLVAIANHGGWPDKVVGTVRIHAHDADVWWGSRLAVDPEFRYQSGIGVALIKLAVGSARGLNCREFYAQVQQQNEALFRKLNWRSHYSLMVRERPHVMMEAQLSRFPICKSPYSGYVLKGQEAVIPDITCSSLLFMPSEYERPPTTKAVHYAH
jgi:putative N-acetyltransferase (TIGR04045 family)